MTRHRRTVTAALIAAGFALFGGLAPAHADSPDDRFAAYIDQIGIPRSPDQDLKAVGQRVCDMLTTGLQGNPNPAPAVRGVVGTLSKNANITKEQAVGLMRASSYVYCPQWGRLIGR